MFAEGCAAIVFAVDDCSIERATVERFEQIA